METRRANRMNTATTNAEQIGKIGLFNQSLWYLLLFS